LSSSSPKPWPPAQAAALMSKAAASVQPVVRPIRTSNAIALSLRIQRPGYRVK
jgi:hypothetical protein